MGVIKHFSGQSGAPGWEGTEIQHYAEGEASQASVRRLIGRAEAAPTFALRYFEVGPGGHTVLESHHYEHGVVIYQGEGMVRLSGVDHPVKQGDVVYIPGWEEHQFRNPGPGVLGFLCMVPADRQRSARSVD